jgi:hypothetical protein
VLGQTSGGIKQQLDPPEEFRGEDTVAPQGVRERLVALGNVEIHRWHDVVKVPD